MIVLAKKTTDATIGSVLPVTTSISHSEQNATSAESQSLEVAEDAIPIDVEAVMADAALVEDEEVVTPTDAEAVMADAALVETEVDGIPRAEVDEILIDVEAETADVTTEAVMMIALTNVIGKHVESAQVTLTIVVRNQFDHVVTKETIETIEVDSVDSRSTLS